MLEPSEHGGGGAIEAVKCPFCSAPWTKDMVRVLDASSSGGCASCGYGASHSATIDITCAACGRLIYRKEYHD